MLLASDDFGYYLYNAHGDVVQLADGSGAVTKDYNYDAFGVQLDSDGQMQYTDVGDALFEDTDTNPWRYCDEYFDTETNTIYLRARYYNPALGRFSSEDPIRDGLNWYTYCESNPIIFIDPWGLAPTPEEALTMCEHIYRLYHEMDDIPELIGGWTMVGNYAKGVETMVMGIYSRTVNGVTEYAIANKGTNFAVWNDIKNDIQGPLGFSKDMQESIEYAELYAGKYDGYELTFVGHSKGGAEAALNAVRTGKNAILFNPMSVMFSADGLEQKRKNYKGNIVSYVVAGDPLNMLFGEMPVGRTVYLPQQAPYSIWSGIMDIPGNLIINHDSPGIRKALEQHHINTLNRFRKHPERKKIDDGINVIRI